MDLTPDHLAHLRGLLESRHNELGTERLAAQQARRELAPASTHDVADLKDEAEQQAASRIDDAHEQRVVTELALVNSALGRIVHGTYGLRADCGTAIGLQRLLVQPAAERCTDCQARSERGHAPSARH